VGRGIAAVNCGVIRIAAVRSAFEAINLVELRDGAIWLVKRRSDFVVVAPGPELHADSTGV
jgi:hypothetical protein